MSWFATPDNVTFDEAGRLWIATDGQPAAIGPNDGVFVTDTEGAVRGRSRMFLSGPAGCEICGPEFTPDNRTLFVAIQHPGEGKVSTFQHWGPVRVSRMATVQAVFHRMGSAREPWSARNGGTEDMRPHRTPRRWWVWVLALGTLAPASSAMAQEPVTSRLKLSIGGYIKPEFMYRTNNGGVSFSGSIPGVQNTGFATVPQKNTIASSNGQFTAGANESRFNFSLSAPDWRGLKSLGFVEVDFLGDTASTAERYCPAGTLCAATQQSGNPAGSINNGALRIRHAFFQLKGEGLGGQWNVLFGQTWNVFGLLPFYSGADFANGSASVFSNRSTQLRVQHSWSFFRDFSLENTIAASQDTTNFNELPGGDISSRLIYRGWQGWQSGTRTPINAGVSARIQRQKADVYQLTAGSPLANTASQANGTRSISATAWGITGGLFVPILPGRSATDRTWGLSVVSEGGYGSGVNAQAIPGTNPYTGALTAGAVNRADPGAVYFKPSSCTLLANPPITTAGGGAPGAANGITVVGAAANACNLRTSTGAALASGGLVAVPTELSLTNTPWASYNIQFYLPYGFWISGGQKWIWYTNADNAFAQTCFNPVPGAGPCGTATNPLITPGVLGQAGAAAANQGQFNPAYTLAAQPASNPSSLFGSRDAQLKRQSYSYVILFYDMTSNIRLGFEWGLHDTARKNSIQDNQSNRWQFGGFFFF